MSEDQRKYIEKLNKNKKMVSILQILLFIVFILVWEFASFIKIIDPFIFSSPSRICISFYKMLVNGKIVVHTFVTMYETLLGFVIGSVLGILIAVCLWNFKILYKILEPYLVIFNSLPKTALAPILIVWIGNNIKSIVVISISLIIVITIFNVINSFNMVEQDKINLIYSFGGNKKDVLKKLMIPYSISTIIGVLKINIGLSLIGVIIGEILVAKNGLGYLIVYGSQVFKLDWVMMSIVILSLLAAMLYKIIEIVEKIYIKNR